ncbi:MAG: phosphatase PAP2 family protein [Burkholderiales bacterium]
MRDYSLERLAAWDRALCRRFNGVSQVASLRFTLLLAGRLGNGAFWYALMAAMVAYDGARAFPVVLRMIVVGLACTALYKSIKAATLRARPYAAQSGITLCAQPLDQYSFPSGHTLHAVAFSLVALTYYPALFWLVLPFTFLVALSRVVLGLHYPSDVIAGAVIGAAVAGLSTYI